MWAQFVKSLSLSVFISSFTFPPIFYSPSTSLTPPRSMCPTVLDTVRPCRDRLSLCSFLFFRTPLTSPVTGEWEKKKNEVESEEEGWIYWRKARAWVDASESGSWWMMRPLGVRDIFIQAGGHAFIYAALCLIYVTHSFQWSTLLIVFGGKSLKLSFRYDIWFLYSISKRSSVTKTHAFLPLPIVCVSVCP